MKEYDLVIRGGTIVDGSGVPKYKADVAVKDGRIAMISGIIKGGAAKELDAGGCIVAPGVVDLHTHYDAQLNWDPYATLSGWVRSDLTHRRSMWFWFCADPGRGPRGEHAHDGPYRGDTARSR